MIKLHLVVSMSPLASLLSQLGFFFQLQQIKKRLIIQEEDSVSDGESGNNEDSRGSKQDDDEEEEIGPNAYISLLDQHSELKKKAEGADLVAQPEHGLMIMLCFDLYHKYMLGVTR